MNIKIGPIGLDLLLATHLSDTVVFNDLISKMTFRTDDDGNIADEVVDNLKTIMKVAYCQADRDGEAHAFKFRETLILLLSYGTVEVSERMYEFLDDYKYPAKRIKILETMSSLEDIKVALKEMGIVQVSMGDGNMPTLEQAINQFRQTEN